MKQSTIFAQGRRFRNIFLIAALSSVLLGASSGCAIFNKKTAGKNNDATISGFEEDSEEDSKNKDSDETVFDSEREKESGMFDFVSSFGRKSKDKKEVDPGQTFLMSDKAKEIYANTER